VVDCVSLTHHWFRASKANCRTEKHTPQQDQLNSHEPFTTLVDSHCEERSDEAIPLFEPRDCFASLAMTEPAYTPRTPDGRTSLN
jgi:hypothetical protein